MTWTRSPSSCSHPHGKKLFKYWFFLVLHSRKKSDSTRQTLSLSLSAASHLRAHSHSSIPLWVTKRHCVRGKRRRRRKYFRNMMTVGNCLKAVHVKDMSYHVTEVKRSFHSEKIIIKHLFAEQFFLSLFRWTWGNEACFFLSRCNSWMNIGKKGDIAVVNKIERTGGNVQCCVICHLKYLSGTENLTYWNGKIMKSNRRVEWIGRERCDDVEHENCMRVHKTSPNGPLGKVWKIFKPKEKLLESFTRQFSNDLKRITTTPS